MEFLDTNQKALILLISAGIRGERLKMPLIIGDGIDWERIVNEAVKHKVELLVYNSLLCFRDIVKLSIIERLRKLALHNAMVLSNNYQAFGSVLGRFTSNMIPVVALKGLVLRELYPDPCLRTMSDYDILIKPHDFKKATVIMADTGYKEVFDKDKHAEFFNPHFKRVEIHRSLVSHNRYNNLTDFEQNVWKNVIPAKVNGVDVLSLNPTDHAVYLVLHMATHIKGGGFGLRQLCDWVLLIEAYKQKIDWNTFDRYIKSMGMEVFTQALFEACHRLFDLEVPQEWRSGDKSLQEISNNLIQDIFDSGVFGKDGRDRITANRMIYYTGGADAKTPKQIMRILFTLLFPKAEKMDIRFEYARKHRFLLPVAWVHRIVYTIARKDIDILEKTAVLRPKKAAEICTNRSLLLHQLGLLEK